MRFTAVVSILALPALSLAATWNDPSTTLYITAPSCAYYQCQVSWIQGDRQYTNWLNVGCLAESSGGGNVCTNKSSPGPQDKKTHKGNVKIVLESTKQNGPTYTIAKSVPGTMDQSSCDGGKGFGKKGYPCGRYYFTVSDKWQPGEYSVAIYSLLKGNGKVGYTDVIRVKAKGNRRSVEQVEEIVDEEA